MLKRTPIWLQKSLFLLQAILAGLGIAFLWILISGRGIPNSSPNNQHFNPVASFADAVERAQPAVVSIRTTKLVPQNASRNSRRSILTRKRGLGSGVIVREDGLILTNFHLIEGVESIFVSLPNGGSDAAKIIGYDKDTDLALLQINTGGVKIKLPTLTFAKADDQHIGDIVLAIGNPYGFGQTVTQGIISATGSANINFANFESFIQTDATISEGNSGGALINTDGELIGINTAVSKQSGLALAIPAQMAKGVVEEILTNGRVIRGWLGFEERSTSFVDANGQTRNLKVNGAVISKIYQPSPASYGDIKPFDILVAIDDVEINSEIEAKYIIASLEPGKSVTLQIRRGEETKLVELEVAERPPNI